METGDDQSESLKVFCERSGETDMSETLAWDEFEDCEAKIQGDEC